MKKAFADFGNSRLKVLFEDKVSSFDYKKDYEKTLEYFAKNNFQEIIYSTVNHSASDKFINDKFIDAEKLIGKSNITFSEIEGMGFDRKLGLISASAKFESPLCTIDCGSAITINFLNDKNCLGGFILPGLGLRYKSLADLDALPLVLPCKSKLLIGKTTQDAIQIGVLHELIFGLKYLIQEIEKQENIKLKNIILTGGDSQIIHSALLNLDISVILQNNLNLDGLKILSK